MFFNNENILSQDYLFNHFRKENKYMFGQNGIEFTSRKGHMNHQNQDSFFVIMDGDVKIYGIFDGHGVNGHLISAFTQGEMVRFIKNSYQFSQKNLLSKNATDQEVTKAIRCCFKYAQEKARAQYKEYLRRQRK